MTNAVKHFRFEPQGKKRLHAKPGTRHMGACRPWLDAEMAAIRPRLIVCLGGTAAQTLLGTTFRITRDRGQCVQSPAGWNCLATYHPSALLRVPDPARRDGMWAQFIADLKTSRACSV